jgi:hypothetical protein
VAERPLASEEELCSMDLVMLLNVSSPLLIVSGHNISPSVLRLLFDSDIEFMIICSLVACYVITLILNYIK